MDVFRFEDPGFSIQTPSILRQRGMSQKGFSSAAAVQSWRPKGLLIGNFTEHREPVTALALAPDHHFFLSAGGSFIKVWDCARLEKNVTNRSRATYEAGMMTLSLFSTKNENVSRCCSKASPVSAVAFCENRRSFAVATTSGSIDIVRVDYFPSSAGSPRYGRPTSVHSLSVDQGRIDNLLHYDEGRIFTDNGTT